MRSGYQMRQWQAAEARDDQACPKCGDRMGAHRDLPARCIVPDCSCEFSTSELKAWRRDGVIR